MSSQYITKYTRSFSKHSNFQKPFYCTAVFVCSHYETIIADLGSWCIIIPKAITTFEDKITFIMTRRLGQPTKIKIYKIVKICWE